MTRIVLAAAASFVLTVAATSAISKSIGNSAGAAVKASSSETPSTGRFVSVGWFSRTVVMR